MADKVKVRVKDTGEVKYVPAHFIGHPVFGDPFEAINDDKTAKPKGAARPERPGRAEGE